MRTLLTILALACALSAPVAASAEPSAKAMELTRRMVVAMHIEQTMAPTMRAMMQQQMDMIVAQRSGLTNQQKTWLSGALSEAIGEVMDNGLMTRVMEKLIPAYAEVYSEAELQAVVDFYESPIGQQVLKKMPLLGPAAVKAMQEITPELQADLGQRVTRKLEAAGILAK